ncbi:uracil-DNA glycosylase family protein [Alkalibacterium kapii]|uniref:Uracil-DNA glycosylase n=1 Tax=Alkalibacterium kapii TaxID=426704 RepID=A0A511AQT7_9LACT|nr:uracil-DNA glycosylase family protein [Alkalibacterium kapii]GEK90564.1 uracil-DNA glycosylase [Alkalibacterium kapii]
MTVFNEIKKEIMAEPMNASYTDRGIEPLYKASKEAKIAIIGQAPGRKAEETQMFWNDPSGDRLRKWMGISRETFYETQVIAHLPMDFYYPGKAKTGDIPPRKGFAEIWHPMILEEMPQLETIILVGSHAQKYYLGKTRKKTLTETVKHYQEYLPDYLPLVHPSPLNHGWLNKNPWFEEDVVPALRKIVHAHI